MVVQEALEADHPRGVQPVDLGDGAAQAGMARIRVDVETVGSGAERLDRCRAGAEGILVGAELQRRRLAGQRRLAALVDGDVEHARLGTQVGVRPDHARVLPAGPLRFQSNSCRNAAETLRRPLTPCQGADRD
ncbi:hypothetical protein CNY89_05335 [Amaricoccus sp. HAR-UPW-R2A-40]|nr:hypothetical protein CNY89_05335 [Amaricoccus sp. HAR-UPW-R2A-40]